MSQFHFDPATYLDLMRAEVPAYGRLQEAVAEASEGMTELVVAQLTDPLPPGPFDLVVSALAVHHLEGPDKAALFARVRGVLRPGGRFVLGDVVIPVDAGFDAAGVWAERDLVVVCADRPD
jgi:SAM-dependent methyltransferase